MRRIVLLGLLISSSVWAQQPEQPQQQMPTPDEQAFARLPTDLQTVLGHLPPRVALQKVDYARQNLIATGNPNPSGDQLRFGVETALDPRSAAVRSMSAGTTSFPPLSPLVPANAFDYR